MNRLITVDELANLLSVSKGWIYARTRKKGPQTIPHIKAGRYIRFESEQVMDWLRQKNDIKVGQRN
ncbi:MAG: helix-turn-helix domain-containing protein [Desulfobacterales bacterium]|nr:MAG: helix-turn-helix domain-containing protein [Desulfobacterales bacterium]